MTKLGIESLCACYLGDSMKIRFNDKLFYVLTESSDFNGFSFECREYTLEG